MKTFFTELVIHRRRFLVILITLLLLVGVAGWFWRPLLWFYLPLLPIVILGVFDLYISDNAILRNFPVLGHIRFLSLKIAPEIHQYFVESSTDGTPFTRLQREMVAERAERRVETHPFGTELSVNSEEYEWIAHSIYPVDMPERPPRITIGGEACRRPYDAAMLNISAMSYGSLSAPAVEALNHGAKRGGFFHDTGEGGISPYHEAAGADLVWEIGSGYFGCRDEEGRFDEDLFRASARKEVVRMIEIKLSQGAKPGHGGVLPAAKVTPEIAKIRNLKPWTTVVSPAYHSTFDDASGLLAFVQRLRELSDGKPVGFKLCIGDPEEFVEICRQMRRTGILPDFITVDGGEGGTGAAPSEFSDSVGMPLESGLVLVVDTLRGYGLHEKIRVIAAGKIVSGYDMLKAFALGADLCNSARGMMFALGCIQAMKCDTNECPTGITTHKSHLTRGLVVPTKGERVANFQRGTVHTAMELLASMGLERFDQIERRHIRKRIDAHVVLTLEDIYPTVEPGSLLREPISRTSD